MYEEEYYYVGDYHFVTRTELEQEQIGQELLHYEEEIRRQNNEAMMNQVSDSDELYDFLENAIFLYVYEVHSSIMTILKEKVHSGDNEISFDYSINNTNNNITLTYDYIGFIRDYKGFYEPPEYEEVPLTLTLDFKIEPLEKEVKTFDDIALSSLKSLIKITLDVTDLS